MPDHSYTQLVGKRLTILDRTAYQTGSEVSFDNWPIGLAVNHTNNNAYVVCHGNPWPFARDGSLTVITPQGQMIATRSLPRSARGIAINAENQTAIVTIKENSKLLVISLESLV